MLINLKSSSPVLVMICRKSVSICNRFQAIRANSGKIMFLEAYPFLTFSFKGNLVTHGHEILL